MIHRSLVAIIAALAAGFGAAHADTTMQLLRDTQSNTLCPSIPGPGNTRSYTCNFGEFSFSHDASGAKDAYANGVKVQFQVDPTGVDDVNIVVQGGASGVDYDMVLTGAQVTYVDAADVTHVIGGTDALNPNFFRCRADSGTSFTGGISHVSHDIVMDALKNGQQIVLRLSASLSNGRPGSGC